MAVHRLLSNPPLREAVIDIRCPINSGFNEEVGGRLNSVIGYNGKKEEMRSAVFTNQITPGHKLSTKADDEGLAGIRYWNEEKTRVVQMKRDGITFSQLRPYQNWTQFLAESLRLWELYRVEMQPVALSRISLRYINRLAFPAIDFSNNPGAFLTPPPGDPKGTNGLVTQWMTRFAVVEPEKDLKIFVTQMSDKMEPTQPPVYPIILDIDVISERHIDAASADLHTAFSILREAKNNVFFGAVTDLALTPYL